MMAIIGFPLLLVSFAIYNIVAFLMPGVSWTQTLREFHLVSNENFSLGTGDALVAVSMLLLFLEMVKCSRPAGRTVVDHLLSLLLFAVFLVEFLVVAQAATGTFFLLVVLSFVDLIGGFVVAIRSGKGEAPIERERVPVA